MWRFSRSLCALVFIQWKRRWSIVWSPLPQMHVASSLKLNRWRYVHYRVHKKPPPVPLLSQTNPFHALPPCWLYSLYPADTGARSFETSVYTNETTRCRKTDGHDLITTFVFGGQLEPVLNYVTHILHASILFWLHLTSRDDFIWFCRESIGHTHIFVRKLADYVITSFIKKKKEINSLRFE